MIDELMENPPVYQWSHKHILLVEDDESSAYLLRQILSHTGATVTHMSDGLQAVDFVREHPDIDLILMDIHLPEKDGFTATREIKAISGGVVVIAQTAYSYSIEQRAAKEAGCDAILTKPVKPAVLLEKLSNYLS
jgi:CheY-like chemotaxis protein